MDIKKTLKQGHCVPCEGSQAPLTNAEEDQYHSGVPDWELERSGEHQVTREFVCLNFMAAVGFINKIATLAESEGHHPNLYLYGYKKLRVELNTHAIKGLSLNDFIMAAKINALWQAHHAS